MLIMTRMAFWSIEGIRKEMDGILVRGHGKEDAPELWDLLSLMLTANSWEARQKAMADEDGDMKMDKPTEDDEAE